MADAAKDRLHELADALPESRFEAAKKALECLVDEACDPVLQAFLNPPEDDEPVTEEDLRDIGEGRKAVAEGLLGASQTGTWSMRVVVTEPAEKDLLDIERMQRARILKAIGRMAACPPKHRARIMKRVDKMLAYPRESELEKLDQADTW
jgi:hypothetical protein